ncbi:hypothetical protein BN136_2946 [Cronobacter universalis NCTC 9529]|nr:hypothetical protein BN136_2946 [Cronobacter universalis NCTC 9529]
MAVDLRRTTLHGQTGNAGKRHRPVAARYAHVADRVNVLPCCIGNARTDIDLPVVQVQARDLRIEIAARRHPYHVADRCGRHATLGRAFRVGADDDLGTFQACGGGDAREALDVAQFGFHCLCARLEHLGIVAGEDDRKFLPRPSTTNSEARACNVEQALSHSFLNDLLRWPIATRPHRERERRPPNLASTRASWPGTLRSAHRGEDVGDAIHIADGLARRLGNRQCVRHRTGRRQLDAHGRRATVGGRDEARLDEGYKGERSGQKDDRAAQGGLAVLQAPARRCHVPAHDPAIFFLGNRLGLEQVGCHHWREQARDEQRREHGDHGGPAELLEDQAANAAHHGGRQEDDHQAHGGRHDGQGDLGHGILCCLPDRFAHVPVALDVLDLDDGVIDQDAHDHRKRQQRDGIEREAQPGHGRERGQDGQR